MAHDTIKVGLSVITAKRTLVVPGKAELFYTGGAKGTVRAILRHPVSRVVTGVILDNGAEDPEDHLVVPATALVAA